MTLASFLASAGSATSFEAIVHLDSKELQSLGAASIVEFRHLGISAASIARDVLVELDAAGLLLGLDRRVYVNPHEHVVSAAALDEGNWGVDALGANEVWPTADGTGVNVAVLDSGVDGMHPSLYAAANPKHVVVDANGEWKQVDGLPTDSGYHGTHVAGIIGGVDEAGRPMGIAPGTRITSIRILDGNSGTIRQTLGGLDAALADPTVRVVNLSIELPGKDAVFASSLKRVVESGRIVVAASGNTGPGHSASPGNYPSGYLISVGASTEESTVWSFSNGALVDWDDHFSEISVPTPLLVAPGKQIVSAFPGGGLKMLSGTSMATPHVSAALAIAVQVVDTLSQGQATALLEQTVKDAGPEGWDFRYGRGLLNLKKLVSRAQQLNI